MSAYAHSAPFEGRRPGYFAENASTKRFAPGYFDWWYSQYHGTVETTLSKLSEVPFAMYSSTSGTRILHDFVKPNCAAWFRHFTMSAPNSISTRTSGFAACACCSIGEKSDVPGNGVSTFLTVLPPFGSMIAVMLSKFEWPHA